MINEPYYLKILSEEFQRRKEQNPEYSLRSFAYEIDLHSSSLSMILNGKRRLSGKLAKKVCSKLKLDPVSQTKFIESTHPEGAIDKIAIFEDIKSSKEVMVIDDSYFSVIAEWEHYVILRLFELENFEMNPVNAAAKLGISVSRVEEVIQNLLNCGLLTHSDDKLVPFQGYIKTTEDIPSDALHASHLETMEIGKLKLEIEPERRDYSSLTLAIDKNKIGDAKVIIREFRKKMVSLMAPGTKTDVYQLSIQFYPMTEQ